MPLPDDNYGRSVSVSTVNNNDIYVISQGTSPYPGTFSLTYITGTSQTLVYQTINSYYPEGYTPPVVPDAVQPLGDTGILVDNSNNLTANTLISTVSQGTPPFVVTSSTPVPNLTASTVTTNANLTGPISSVGNTTSVSSQTGTGSTFVMDTSPTLISPYVMYTHVSVNTGTYTVLSTDQFIGVIFTASGSCNITLPQISIVGKRTYYITDEGGNCATNFITIYRGGTDLISGNTSIILNGNYNSVSLYNNGTNSWFIC